MKNPDLLTAFDNERFGHPKSEMLKERIARQRAHYAQSEEQRHGVVGIHIKLLDKLPGET
jgi:hypothetical protein